MLRKKRTVLVLVLAVLFLAGCQEKKDTMTDGSEVYVKKEEPQKKAESKETEEEKDAWEEVLFLVTGVDTSGKTVSLRSCSNLKEKEYEYNGATYIKDEYGKNLTMDQLMPGEMVNAAVKKDKVTSIEVSDEVFTYGDIHSFVLNQENKSIIVGNNHYYYENDIMVFYKNSSISLAEISERDTICLKGIDKKIFSIQVLEGHGTVVLENTDLFEGGSITIGNILSMEVTPKMRIEVPEGTHLLSVAKDGYGDSREITVEANREISVDLEELKGEGPKYCTIAIVIEPDSGTVYLNGETVDLSQNLQLKYGTYTLSAKAEGYADWKRTLVVKSEKANIKIELQTEEEQKKAEEQTASKKEAEKSAKEQEEETKKLIEKIRNGTLSTANGIDSSTSSNTSGTTGTDSIANTGTSTVIK